MGVERDAVRADHGAGMGHRGLHVLLVHHEVDGAGRLDAVGGFLHRAAHLVGDLLEVATAQARHLVGPGDQHLVGALQHVGAQDRRAGDVGVNVEGNLLLLHRFVEVRQRLLHAAEVGAARALVVRDDDLGADAAADLEGLVHRLQDVIALVAHVGGVDAAPLAERRGHFDDLVGRGVARHGIEQAARHADGALFEALVEQLAHLLDLGAGGDAVEVVAHRVDAQRAVADQEGAVDGGLCRVNLVGELGEAGGEVLLLLDDQRHPVADVGPDIGRGRDAAIAADHRRHALAGLHGHAGIVDQRRVVVRVHVDEARRHDLAGGVDFVVALQGARRLDRGDAIAFKGDVGGEQLPAGAVGHLAVADDDVVVGHGNSWTGNSWALMWGNRT